MKTFVAALTAFLCATCTQFAAIQETEEVAECYEEPYSEYADYSEDYSEPYYGGGSYESDGFKQQGIRGGVDSETETWYSSESRYHKDTAQWSTDSEGYYRDSDGYYVVSSNDYEYGTVITTSKGEARVLDDGTDSGNVDFYVAW